MKSSVIFLICLLPIAAFLLLLLKGTKKRKSRDPAAEIERIRTMKKPLQIARAFGNWSDPEIRRAAANQLPAEETAQLLTAFDADGRREFLAYIDDPEKLEAIRSFCSADGVTARLESVYLEKIEKDPDPSWLAAQIRENANSFVRKKAVEKLADRKLLSETARTAAAAADEKLLELLLDRLDELDGDPDDDAAAAIAGDPAYAEKIRKAAVRHVWDLGTLERLKESSGLYAACERQRCEAICRKEGHQWERVPINVFDPDLTPDQIRVEGRKTWVIPDYRCPNCGLVRKGEKKNGEWILKYS